MLFSKKGPSKSGQVRHDEKSLYPVLHVTECLKGYQKDLAKKEVESLFELSMIGNSSIRPRGSSTRCGRTSPRPCRKPRAWWRS